jgi:hypothetical protein
MFRFNAIVVVVVVVVAVVVAVVVVSKPEIPMKKIT